MLLILPQVAFDGSSAAGYDLSLTANAVLARLGANSWADLDWLTDAEVFAYFDEAAKRLAEHTGLFVDRAMVNVAANEAQYANPDGWIDSEQVSLDGGKLRRATTAELAALDATWQTTPGTPTRYSPDAGPLGTITLYPLPQAGGAALAQIYQRFPADISTAQTLIPAPTPLSDYFLYFALMRARGKESPGAMPEMAAHFAERVQLYEQIFASYWGAGE